MKHKLTRTLAVLLIAITGLAAKAAVGDANRGYVEDFRITAGTEMDLTFRIASEGERARGVQTEIVLPEGLSFVQTNGKYAALTSDYATGYQISSNAVGSVLKVVALGATTTGRFADGDVFTFRVSADAAFKGGVLKVQNTIIATESEETMCADEETVIKGIVEVTSISIDKAALYLEVGESAALTATVTPEDATDVVITWESSDTDIATVDADGKVTAVAVGTAVITARCGEFDASCQVTVDEFDPLAFVFNEDMTATVAGLKETAPEMKTLVLPTSKSHNGEIYEVTAISNSAFAGCTGLTGELVIPATIKTIGDDAFAGCTGLTGVLEIPETLTAIGAGAFSGCSSLESVRSLNPTPPALGAGAFDAATVIRISAGAGEAYRAAENWGDYENLYEYGDANWSKSITVTDAVADANYIVGAGQAGTFDFECGDISMNGTITVFDAVSIIDAASKYNPSGLVAAPRRASDMTAGRLIADDFTAMEGYAIGVRLEAERTYVALQADFVFGNGINIENITVAPSVAATHTLTVSRFENEGILRAILFSTYGAAIECGSEALFTLELNGNGTGNIDGINVIAASADASEHILGYEGGNNSIVTGVDGIDGGKVRVLAGKGCVTIMNAAGERAEIYDLAGRRIKAFTVDSDADTTILPSGFYLVTVKGKATKLIL